MPTEVELPDGVIAEFPDEMSEDDIKTVLRKKFPAPEQPPAAPLDFTAFQRDEASPFSGIPTSSEEIAAANFQRDMEIRKTFPDYEGMRGVPFDPQEGILSGLTGLTPESVPSGKGPITIPLASVGRTAFGVADYLSSPQGIAELATSLTPARLLVLSKWAADMAKGAGEEAGTLSTLIAKPDKTLEDWQQISDRSVNTLAMIFGSGAAAKGASKPLRRAVEPPKMKAIRELETSLLETDPAIPITRPTAQRQLGIPQAPLTGEPFLQPGIREMAGAALREAQGPRLEIPGELSALETLRREVAPPRMELTEPTRLAERIPGGGEAPYGKVSYRRQAEAPTVRQMRPLPPGFGEEITAPSVETVRAQRELEARQKGGEKYALQQETETAFRPVRESEIAETRPQQVPAPEGRPPTAEARVITEQAFDQMPAVEKATLGHRPGMEYGITLTEVDVPRLEAKYQAAGREMQAAVGKVMEAMKQRDEAQAKGDPAAREKADQLLQAAQLEQSAAFGKNNFYGGALQGATRGKHTAAAGNYEGFARQRAAEGRPIPEREPTVERVTPLDPQSGAPLSATESLINRLEALKFPETGEGRLYSLPHPDAIKAIGRSTWNSAVDVAITSIKAGKAIAQAVDDAIKYLKTQGKKFDEVQTRANMEYVTKAETEARQPAAEPTVTVKEGSTPTQVNLPPKILSNLTAQRGLPTDIFNAWAIGRGGFVKDQMNRTAHGIRELYRAISKQYNIGFGERMLKGFTQIPPEQVRMMNDYLRGVTEITSVPEGLRPTLSNLRAHIDSLSNTMIREGLTNDKLAAVIGDNLGMYLRRSYRVFDDPKWGLNRMVPQNQQRVVSGMLQELRRENPNATVQDALNNIEAVLNEYRRTGEEGSFFGKGSTIGSKDLSLFFKRKDISDWWRTMMGEYETPVTNYAKTVSKMARFIADQRFLNAVEQAGVGKYLFEQPTTGHTARIAAEGSPSLSPLSKYYTTPEIARAFREFYDRPAAANPVWQFIMGITYVSKAAKTVGSFLTQARNLLSQPFFWLRNGHWDVREAWPALRSVYADVLGKEGAFLEYYRDAIRHGVANDTAQVGELRAVLKDVIGPRDFDVPVDLLAARSVAKTVRRAVVDPVERLYRTSDELGKLVGWEVEKFYMKKINPDWSEAQIKNEAAIRVRNLYPTYSMISRFGKAAGKQPVFGPFISFPLEVIRTSYWAGKYAVIDLASTNPWQRLRGAKMLVGQFATYAGLFALASAVRQMFGVTKEQDEDLRRFMPEWSKNAQLLYLGPIENGRAEYVNLSYINPFSYMIDPVVAVAAFDADTYDERFWEAAKEFVRPFTSEQMTANAVVDLLRNQTESGRRVYNPEEDAPHKIKDVAKHIWEPVEPGTLTRLRRRIIPALRGEQPVTGQELSVTRELVSELTGIKAEGNDVETGISFKLRGFNRAEQDVENIWRSKLLSGGSFPPEAVASEYARMDGIRRRVWEELREDILAAKRLGISDEKVSGMLKSAGLSAETQNKILAGDYRPYSPSVDLLKKAIERGKEIPENTFGDDIESKLKLRQAKTELTGNARDILTAKNNVARFRRLKKAEEIVIESTLTERDKQSRLAEIRRQIGLIQ